MPFSKLSVEQITSLLAEYPRIMKIPGVALVVVEFVGPKRSEVAVVVTVYAGTNHDISLLPFTVAGLPVIVKVEDRHTGRVLDMIDPRAAAGSWPLNGHRK